MTRSLGLHPGRRAAACSRFRLALLPLLLSAFALPGAGAENNADEHEIKAAFVLNFIKFVTWAPRGDDLPVCVLKETEISQALNKLVAGKQVAGKRVWIRVMDRPDPEQCRVLLVDPSQYRQASHWLKEFGKNPVLTIGDGRGFLDAGGMLQLVVENRRVQFDASLSAIQRTELSVSASLLRLARNLKEPARRD